VFEPIVGEARTVLKDLLDRWGDVSANEGIRLQANEVPKMILHHLKEAGLLKYTTYAHGGYRIQLEYRGVNYFLEEQQYEAAQNRKAATTISNVSNSVVQVGSGNQASNITATGLDDIFQKLISNLDACIPPEQKVEIIENAEFIRDEMKAEKPRKGIINTCMEKLNSIALDFPQAVSFIADLATIGGLLAIK